MVSGMREERVVLAQQILVTVISAHRGVWDKSASGSIEVRGKTLGIVGYRHIGTQVGVLAELLGVQ